MERGLVIGEEGEVAQAPAETAISARSLSKTFTIPRQRYSTVRDRILHPFSSQGMDTLTALREVSLDVSRGEFFGVVGKNGSGKSTLLRCLAGIYRPDAGSISVAGRMAPFIELGLGFDEEMTARDNTVISAVLMGMRRRDAAARFEQILSFAELEEFRDLKLRNYSSGMAMRLSFSIVVHLDADVYLFDEVLAVGDEAFRRKCFDRFGQLREEGRTVILVTHDMQLIRSQCDRAALLHEGRIIARGDGGEVAEGYERLNAETGARQPTGAGVAELGVASLSPGPAPSGTGRVESERVSARRLGTITWTLAVAQFRLRYLDSALSYAWTVARPLALFGVLLFVFTRLGRFDQGVNHYPAYLLTTIVVWTYFSQATATSVQSLVYNSRLLRRLPLPHSAIPLATVLTAIFDLAMNMLVVLFFVLVAGIAPRISWIEVPVIVALISLLVTGLAMVLSALYVRLRDVNQIWQVASQTIFYVTPIFYVTTTLPADLQEPSLSNPIAAGFAQIRHAFIDPSAPTAAQLIGGAELLLIPLGLTIAVFGLGLIFFRSQSRAAVERL